jgi:bifunctional enzyme CysN/CysC
MDDLHAADDAQAQVAAYLQQHETKDLLRFITCGSVDDGKSTLIGRLLHDTKLLLDDQLAALESDSRRHGTQGDDIDFALLVDGLAAEREQGITIDVAYRFFGTERRKFIVADCPGHEQYTRNMATGASTADLAIVLVDARKGLLTQTRRHSYIVSLLGIRTWCWRSTRWTWSATTRPCSTRSSRATASWPASWASPTSPRSRCRRCAATTCQQPSPQHAVVPGAAAAGATWRRSRIERAVRGDLGFGCRCSGSAGRTRIPRLRRHHRRRQRAPGMEVVVLPSGRRSNGARVVTEPATSPRATAGQAVTLTLADEVDISRGDVIAAAAHPPEVADQFAATCCGWTTSRCCPAVRTG